MAQKFFYVVDHYVPFPSEYGGIWNVIAEDDDECFELIVAEDDGTLINLTITNFGRISRSLIPMPLQRKISILALFPNLLPNYS